MSSKGNELDFLLQAFTNAAPSWGWEVGKKAAREMGGKPAAFSMQLSRWLAACRPHVHWACVRTDKHVRTGGNAWCCGRLAVCRKDAWLVFFNSAARNATRSAKGSTCLQAMLPPLSSTRRCPFVISAMLSTVQLQLLSAWPSKFGEGCRVLAGGRARGSSEIWF